MKRFDTEAKETTGLLLMKAYFIADRLLDRDSETGRIKHGQFT